MLNAKLKLNTKIFDKDIEQIPIRQGFGEGLLEAGKKKYSSSWTLRRSDRVH